MKSNIFKAALLLTFALFAYNFTNQVANFVGTMQKTMQQMEAIKLTGDPDYDFASLIRLHHKGGIEMLNDEIKNGIDSATVKLARKLKENLEKDQNELETFISNHQIGASNADFLKDVKSDMQTAKDAMNNNMSAGGNVDKDFAALMALHHAHGMSLANLELKYGKDEKMKNLAEKMLDNQKDEQKELLKLRDK